MPPYMSASKIVSSFLSRNNGGIRQLTRFPKSNNSFNDNHTRLQSYDFYRLSSSSSSVGDRDRDRVRVRIVPGSKSVRDLVSSDDVVIGGGGGGGQNVHQMRPFIGCGDGEEGSVLSKVYEEKLVMGYTPDQLYNVVAAVDLYEGFVPWCQRSEIVKRYPDGSFDAELEIGFKFLVESYVSHVELSKGKFVKSTVSQSSLFDHLINIWEFKPGPVPGTCDVHFFVDFKFQSPLYRQVASVFFKEVVSRLVGSFNERCRLVYGPGVRVHENTYGQRA